MPEQGCLLTLCAAPRQWLARLAVAGATAQGTDAKLGGSTESQSRWGKTRGSQCDNVGLHRFAPWQKYLSWSLVPWQHFGGHWAPRSL